MTNLMLATQDFDAHSCLLHSNLLHAWCCNDQQQCLCAFAQGLYLCHIYTDLVAYSNLALQALQLDLTLMEAR